MVTPSITPTENIRSWQEHEFWEDVESARRRRQRWWIAGTCVIFIILSALPVWWDRSPKWGALRLARDLSDRLNQVKRLAAVNGRAHRVRIEGGLRLALETSSTCVSKDWVRTESMVLGRPGDEARWELLTASEAERRAVPGVLDQFCYDPITGYAPVVEAGAEHTTGWAVAPVVDRSNGRLDRMAVVFIQGAGADLQFE